MQKKINYSGKNEIKEEKAMGFKTIQRIREEKGMSIPELAVKSNISQSMLKKIESGEKRSPGISIIKDIARGLDVDYIDLFIAYGYLEEKDVIKRVLSRCKTADLARELLRRKNCA